MRHFGLHVGFCTFNTGRRHGNFHVQLIAVLHIESQNVARSFLSWVLLSQFLFADDWFVKFDNEKVFSFHPLRSTGITRNGFVVLKIDFVGQYMLMHLLFAPHQSALEIGKYIGRLVFVEHIFVESHMWCSSNLYLHIIVRKVHSIVSWCCLFAH